MPLARRGDGRAVGRPDGGNRVAQQAGRLSPWQAATTPHAIMNRSGQGPLPGPAGQREFRCGWERLNVAHAQICYDIQVRGQLEGGRQFSLLEEAHPADAEPLGPGGEPEILDRADARVHRHLRLGVAAKHVPAPPGGVARHDDADRSVQDGLDLERAEGQCPRPGQRGSEQVLLGARERMDARARRAVPQDDEVPRLAQADAGRLVRGRQHPGEQVVADRVWPESVTHIPARGDQPVERVDIRLRKAVIVMRQDRIRHGRVSLPRGNHAPVRRIDGRSFLAPGSKLPPGLPTAARSWPNARVAPR